MTKPRDKGGMLVINIYRSAVVAGISALLWMQSHFMTREFFLVYKENQERHENELMQRIDKLENKVDTLLRENKLAFGQRKRMEDKYE
jgi:hypothetical protein